MSESMTPEQQACCDANEAVVKAVQVLAHARAVLERTPMPLVQQVVICWEEAVYDDQGEIAKANRWSVPTDQWSPAATLGLLMLTQKQLSESCSC